MVTYYISSASTSFNVDVSSNGKIVKISPMPIRSMRDFIGSDFSKFERAMRNRGKYKKIVRRVGNPSDGNPSDETEDTIRLVMSDELLEMDILNNDPWALANQCGIRITSNKELLASYVDTDEGIVIAAIFDNFDGMHYSFDTVVHSGYRRLGLAKKLIGIAMDTFLDYQSSTNAILLLHVINPVIVPYLMKKYDLMISNRINEDYILSDR